MKISRRFFLGGAGALIALPALESLSPRGLRAEPSFAKRILAYYVPCGIHMPAWTPSAGPDLVLSPTLSPLAKVKEKTLVITGLQNLLARPDGPGDHASGTGAFLTCAHPFKTEGDGIANGISMDQVAANELKKQTRIASLQLGIDGGGGTGNCDSGYSCAYARNISWASASQPLPKNTSPQVVFDTLFAGFDPKATAAEQAKRMAYQKSVLDYAIGDASSLRTKLGSVDRAKLDEYLDSVREVEKQITTPTSVCTQPSRPASDYSFTDKARIMADLMVLAFQCDSTRVISFMLGNAGDNRTFDFLGVSGGHHEISHHGGLTENFDKLKKIDKWEIEQLAYLCEKMDSIKEANGLTMLDNSLVFFSSEIEDGDAHRHTNLPVVVVGSDAGAIKTNRHVVADKAPLANLFTTMLNAAGVKNVKFGDGSGPLAI
ncbi:MAG: DUF1552 domain-containing protein [Polyangiales bacterium]